MQLSKAAELNKRKGFEHLVKCEMVTKRRQREIAKEKEERERVAHNIWNSIKICVSVVTEFYTYKQTNKQQTNNKQTTK